MKRTKSPQTGLFSSSYAVDKLMMKNRTTFLFEKALRKEISAIERKELFRLLAESGKEDLLKQLFEDGWLAFEEKEHFFFAADESNRMMGEVLGRKRMVPEKKDNRHFLHWAAVLILGIGVGTCFYLKSSENQMLLPQAAQNVLIKPGGNRATLALADGKVLDLDNMENQITKLDGVRIHKNEKGQLIYEIEAAKPAAGERRENVLTTPKGGQFQLVLPDGTKVWLSASSSLRYPTRFVGTNRSVTLSGEAYFEVARNLSMPFEVNVEGATIHVLGTSFLVNAYEEEEETKTTLFEGKVRVAGNLERGQSAKNQQILHPGQQATLNRLTNNMVLRSVDITDALALKNGYFVFQHDDIHTVMAAIARWYDVEIVYEGDVSGETFIGTVSKFDRIDKLLKTIELTGGVHFKIEGRKVLVMK